MGKPSSKRSRHMSAWVPLDVVAALVARAEADECSISHAMMAAVRKGLATTAPDARPLGPLDGLTPGEIRRYQAVADYAGRSLEDIVRASLEGSIRAAQAAGRLLDIPAADG